MNRRTGVVVLFVGVLLVLGVWFMLPGAFGPVREAKAPVVKDGKIQADRLRAVPLGEGPDVSLRAIAARQERLSNLTQRTTKPGARPPGVFALDERGVAAAVSLRRPDLEACYETALFHSPELQGTLTLVLQVEPQEGEAFGRVTSVETEGDLEATVFEGCVATVFEEIKFDTKEPATLRYPVTFEPPK
jgi:hypothetical protein